ncbi:3-deoxy-manno-octulosonate cytidylyltransferase [Pseudoteredinibacter isoporae]|uniref:3-deoxy-manno-octulosonate cytidylyltransferase n=1 Tax=Pseudoteredinibacter isoporae TaxID=570281 RepID=A0A7X0JUH3_9GAMM|nr:3-deoxy-manno-octulosonate cytidylyltransferase [Pseudoteredinibacter isoporae]MBB6521933.1 3-deoxy-manno-octulosonate cytidylyltransferase (CMP-KDO synthetase) [Pseudoteredinibacter isoporae]NHO87470.1 3-deoxy-manno-octulosonate cytidylyltransferase [Pseudoteredinibacter isoporae]NIB24199.1 3-deoxy-manno-octulosonate cytidylyltransferase [Pseudoteredinibacter isoporae]
MEFFVVIPARYASSRLPAKPLADIAGKPMIQWVVERAQMSDAKQVIVATDDERIEAAVKAFGGEVCMTRTDHQSGTDRLQEVAEKYGLAPDAIVVNVQGDEPLIPPEVINQVANNLDRAKEASVATLSEPIHSVEDFCNPNIVKAVSDEQGIALTFSRAPVPWPRDAFAQSRDALPEGFVPQRHIGIYAYRVALLNRFVTWDVAPIEATESLEQLRVLWHGEKIHLDEACAEVPGGVDTPEDLQRVVDFIQGQ